MAVLLSVGMVCPKCRQNLVGPNGTNRAALSDMLSCPNHGNIGRFEDMIQKSSDNVQRRVESAIVEFLKRNTEAK